jgi:hypothetical protein
VNYFKNAITLLWLFVLIPLCHAAQEPPTKPSGIQPVWDITFARDKVDLQPSLTGLTDRKMVEMREKKEDIALPLTGFASMEYLLPTRTALVKENACGLPGNACLLEVAPTDPGAQAGSSRGPFLHVFVPPQLWPTSCWRLAFDIVASRRSTMGGISLTGRGGLPIWDFAFYLDGKMRSVTEEGSVEVCGYTPQKPLHIEVVIDTISQTVTVYLNQKTPPMVELPWTKQATKDMSAFVGMHVYGASAGGHCNQGQVAIDNIRLEPEKPNAEQQPPAAQ